MLCLVHNFPQWTDSDLNRIRLAPPLVIDEEDLTAAVNIIRESLLELDTRDVIEDLSNHDTQAKFVSL